MADPVVIVEKIIEIAIKITDAVETVRENKEECRGIEKLVRRVSDLLSLLKKSEMMRHRVIGGPLEDLEDAIRRAHDVVTACQGKDILCLFCKAGKLAKKLSQVKNDISRGMMRVIFASHTAASVFVAPKGQQSAVTVNVFPVRTHRPPPLSERLPSGPSAFVEDLQPSLSTHEAPRRSPDAVLSNDMLPSRPAREPPYAPVIAGVSNLDPHSHTRLSPTLPPPSPPRTNVAPLSKYQPRRQPKQPTPAPPQPPPPPPPPPPPAPCMIPYIPSPQTPPSRPPSHPLPTYVTSPVPKQQRRHSSTPTLPPRHPPIANIAPPLSKHQPPSSPTRSSLPPPSRPPPANPITNIGPTKPGHLPGPSSDALPHSASQNTTEVLAPISGPVSFTPSTEDVCGKSDERKYKPVESEAPAPPLPGLTKFSLTELKNATQNFSEKNNIGSIDFGTIYKGLLHNRVLVAIKKFRDPPPFLVARLSAQLHLASKLQTKDVDASRNNKYIIRFLGYGHECIWENQCLETQIFLVEEYLPNGNMRNNIYGEYRLHWSSLFRIIQGLAQGLNFLHEQHIIHRNVKRANVLLDSDMNPKITDFGIARILLEKSVIHDNNIAGTVGYMSPEYILEGTLSTKYDVYSFGVTLLETISGMCRSEPARHHASVPWAWNVRDNKQMGELFEPSLFDESQLMEIKRCLEIGLLCTQFKWAERPTMAEVLDMLNGKIGLGTPKQPEYTKERVITSKGASHKVRSGK